MTKKGSTLMKRRITAIIVSVIAVIILAVTLAVVLDHVNSTSVEDPADGTVYYIRKKDSVYSLYDTDKKTVMPTEEKTGYYVTHASTIIDVDAETGEYEIIAVVDTEGNEQVGFNQRLLMFPHVEMVNILSIEVHNEHGDFSFARTNKETGKLDAESDFMIVGSPFVRFDEELISSLCVSAGYTLTMRKIEDPIKDENGEFSEYGLVPEHRVREVMTEDGDFDLNDDGSYKYEEYDYEPAYYVLTDADGNKYKVIIGDLMVTGGGYYVQYVDMSGETEAKRDAVYVLSNDISESLLAPVEDFVTPQLTYQMTMNTYVDVEKFYILNKNHDAAEGEDAYDEPIVGFSYIDLSERENSIRLSEPYVFLGDFALDGYMASSDNIDIALRSLYEPSFVKVAKLAPSIEDFVKYGLAFETTDDEGNKTYEILPEHIITFNYDVTDENGDYVETVNNRVLVSALTEDDTRYVFTEIYSVNKDGSISEEPLYDLGMIAEVNWYSLSFLDWDRYDWIDDTYVKLNIAFCDKITLETPDYSATFEIDNSESDSVDSVSSTNLKVHATDSNGHDMTTFSQLVVTDESGNIWQITGTDIKCYSSAGKELKITTASYAYNMMSRQVRVISGAIKCADGSKVYVSADTVRVVSTSGETSYTRYDTQLFRQFYRTLLEASISDSYEVSAEEEAAICTEENLLLTMTITNSDGEKKVYKFYKLTSRKAYITINGNGQFYVLNNRVQKFVSDAQKFFAGEFIDFSAKN